MNSSVCFLAILVLLSCNAKKDQQAGSIERIDAALNAIIDEKAGIEIIAEGME